MAFQIHAEMDSHCQGGRLRLGRELIRSVSADEATAELSAVHPWHCPADRPLTPQTRAPISTATPALIYHRSRDRQHICARTRSGEERGERRRDNGAGGGEGRAGGNMVAGRIGIAHSARLFKGHILFEGPHATLRATSLSLSIPPPPPP